MRTMMFSLQLSKIFRRCSAQGADNRRWFLSLASSLETWCTGREIAGLATGTSSGRRLGEIEGRMRCDDRRAARGPVDGHTSESIGDRASLPIWIVRSWNSILECSN